MRTVHILLLCSVLLLPAATGHAATGQTNPAQAKNDTVRLETSLGDIIIELDGAKAPLSAANFKNYVKSGFYDGTIFHRVISTFMIQGGGFTPEMKQKHTQTAIRNEADNKLGNKKYTLAMARTNDPHSATAQFFINVKDNSFLDHKAPSGNDWGYAVFGKVIQGTEVVDRIARVKTGNRAGHQDVPLEPVLIVKADILQ
ncbi:MAG: peptidyl-prolyl cis-trans isomerase [Deltaproteobacteria bacterium]|jgi:peptidyl-prolyl cis-trans isomerase B (cyclophilin B)|nr:peptidyl-prolyl cis-trans isomerase [Deltaproteobacteria bacterium]